MLYVSGQGPVDPVTQQFVYGTFDEQVTLTLRNLRSIVEAAGGSLANAVKVNVFLRDMANFDRLNAIYPDFFPEPHPARTTCQSALPGFEVEIDCIVALGED
jgi:2-iminobutanoate/2-iminopropanoate deaminase